METIGDARGVPVRRPRSGADQTDHRHQAGPHRTPPPRPPRPTPGRLTGSDEVLQAAFQRVGVLRVDTISELFDMAEVLAKQPRPRGPRLTIVTNAGGPGVLATDMLDHQRRATRRH